jgi:hypothetical protein
LRYCVANGGPIGVLALSLGAGTCVRPLPVIPGSSSIPDDEGYSDLGG